MWREAESPQATHHLKEDLHFIFMFIDGSVYIFLLSPSRIKKNYWPTGGCREICQKFSPRGEFRGENIGSGIAKVGIRLELFSC